MALITPVLNPGIGVNLILPAVDMIRSGDGSTLYKFDGGLYDAVRFPTNQAGPSVCVSVQKGCSLGVQNAGDVIKNACRFCSTGRYRPFEGNLSAAEIANEARVALADTPNLESAAQIRIFFAGMGDSSFNPDGVVGAMTYIQNEYPAHTVNFAIATIGTPPAMVRRLGDRLVAAYEGGAIKYGTQVYLQLSMHGAIDEKRGYVIPVAKKHKLGDVLSGMLDLRDRLAPYMGVVVHNDKYPDRYLVTLNYLMLGKKDEFAGNATGEDLMALTGLLQYFGPENFVVRLSGYNPDKRDGGRSFQTVEPEVFDLWAAALKDQAPGAVVRKFKSKASDVRAGCGQLGQDAEVAQHGFDAGAKD